MRLLFAFKGRNFGWLILYLVLTENYFYFLTKHFKMLKVECRKCELGSYISPRRKITVQTEIDNDILVVYSGHLTNNWSVEIFTFILLCRHYKGSVCLSNLTNIQRSTMALSLLDIDGGGFHCEANRPQRVRGCSCVIYRLKI